MSVVFFSSISLLLPSKHQLCFSRTLSPVPCIQSESVLYSFSIISLKCPFLSELPINQIPVQVPFPQPPEPCSFHFLNYNGSFNPNYSPMISIMCFLILLFDHLLSCLPTKLSSHSPRKVPSYSVALNAEVCFLTI